MVQAQKQQSYIAPEEDAATVAPRAAGPAEAFSDAIKHPEGWRPSPARQMQEQLATWAAQNSNPETALTVPHHDLPIATRLAIIGAMSTALWGMILGVTALILPIW